MERSLFESKVNRTRLWQVGTFITSSLLQGYFLFRDLTERRSYHDHVMYAPHPMALLVLFTIHTLIQWTWLIKGPQYGHRPKRDSNIRVVDAVEIDAMISNVNHPRVDGSNMPLPQTTGNRRRQEIEAGEEFAALYTLGNVSLSLFPLAFLSGNYVLCRLTVFVVIVAQLYSIFAILQPQVLETETLPKRNRLSHFIAKTRLGLGILYLWKTWGAFEIDISAPTLHQQILAFLVFLGVALASGPDPTLGICITFSLYAMAFGPLESVAWSSSFMRSAAIIGTATTVDWAFAVWSVKRRTVFSDSQIHG